jgi:hypothetical protein
MDTGRVNLMAKKNDTVYTLHDDEPNPFEMIEADYEKAREEYTKKIEAENKKLEEWRTAHKGPFGPPVSLSRLQ